MLKIAIPVLKPEKITNYLNALRSLGAEPVIVSIPTPEAAQPLGTVSPAEAEECAGLLLPGGMDVEPARYRQETGPKTEIEPYLDDLQMEVLRRFTDQGKPVFGICRGHQLLNVFFGGTLIQHLPTAEKTHVWKQETGDSVHPCLAEKDSFIARIYGERFFSNSSHHQGVDRPGKGLRIVARSESDGVVEALEHETLPVWSVQFHPERMGFAHPREDTADGSRVIRWFLDQI